MSTRPRVRADEDAVARRRLWAERVAAQVALGHHTTPPPQWRDTAACARHSRPDLWVPFSPQAAVNAAAAQVCDHCPARTHCLTAALLDRGETGVRAGVSESTVTKFRNRFGTADQ